MNTISIFNSLTQKCMRQAYLDKVEITCGYN